MRNLKLISAIVRNSLDAVMATGFQQVESKSLSQIQKSIWNVALMTFADCRSISQDCFDSRSFFLGRSSGPNLFTSELFWKMLIIVRVPDSCTVIKKYPVKGDVPHASQFVPFIQLCI